MPQIVAPHTLCRFGIARRDVTPPVGIYHRMWGAAAHDRSEGVHRPLEAAALVFESPEMASPPAFDTRHVFIALDHCLLFAPEMEALLERVCSENRLEREQVTVAFSHTHAAGLMDPRRAELPGGDLIGPYLERLGEMASQAVREALAGVDNVCIAYSAARCDLAANRDYWDEQNELFVCGLNPEAAADDTVLAARITDLNGDVRAVLVNYACHPTTLAWDNRQISPDFPGAMREVVETATGAPCVFLQGASGDLGPREGFVGDTAIADRNGRQLGHAALAALSSLGEPLTKLVYSGPVISGATIGAWRRETLNETEIAAARRWNVRRFTVDLPYREGMPDLEETRRQLAHWRQQEQSARDAGDTAQAADARAMVERMNRWQTRLASLPSGDAFPLPVVLVRLGGAWIVAVEGEPYNVLQRALRERYPVTPILMQVLANGSRSWYLPTAETYGKGIYQESMANLAPGCLETLIERIGDEMAKLASV